MTAGEATAKAAELANLASRLADAQRHAEAAAVAAAALEIDPCCAPALFNQAVSLMALGDPAAARERLRQLARLTPHDPRVYNNLGLAESAAGEPDAALQSFGRALALQPAYARAWNNRATTFMKLGAHASALADLERALALDPHYARAWLNRGATLRALGRYEAALDSYRRAFPDPDALANATILATRELARPAEALAYARELYRRAPEREDAAGTYHKICQEAAVWGDYDERIACIVAGVRAGGRPATPFRFLYVTDAPEDQLRCARATAASFPARAPLFRGEPYRHARIRIGYLSSDFQRHAIAYLAAGLFEHHDRVRFECFAYAHGRCAADDPVRPRLAAAFEHFADVDALSAAETAQRIRADEIDVLVDLNGYTNNSRLETLSYRPAPVQAHYLGYPGTLGAPFVDYLLADARVIPEHEAPFYTEQIVRLPYTYQVTDDRREAFAPGWTRARAGLADDALVLAAFHQTYKLNPPVFEVWMRLLRALPDACLWLLVRDPAARANVRREAQARGVDPDRIVFADQASQADHLARQRLADLLLDTWPYGAHTTASDALWAGLPVVALTGRSFAARVSGSILHAAGLDDLITDSLESYEKLVLELCGDRERLAQLKGRIAASVRDSPLFATAAFTRALEDAYEQMLRRHLDGLPPAPIEAAWPASRSPVT